MRCWAEINIQNLYKNIDEIKRVVPKDKIMTVIKADAYGHGMLEICRALLKKGIKNFAVATIEEALKIRKIDKKAFILILGPVQNENMKLVYENDIYFTLTDLDEIDYLEKNKQKANVFIKIDTGMGRVGFCEDDIEILIEKLQKCKYINVKGVFSHLSSSDTDIEYTKYQEEEFKKISTYIESKILTIKYKHLLNSFGTLKCSDSVYDFVRVGIIMYGGVSKNNTYPYEFCPVMTLLARVSYIKTLKKDSFVSYDNTYRAKKGDTLATISIGYADGLRRELSNKGYVYYKGHKCKIVGRVCMDQTIILISKELANDIKKGDIVEIFGENIKVSEVANICNTISYEILCGVSQRVPRMIKD